MAMDLKVFKTRALSAILFGVILIGGLLGGKLPFILLFAVVSFLCAREFYSLNIIINKQNPNEQAQILFSVGCALFFMYVAEKGEVFFIQTVGKNVLYYLLGFLLLLVMSIGMTNHKKMTIALILGYIYIGLSFGLLARAYRIDSLLPFYLIICIWVNDTMQYIVGANFGKTKMAPIISPKKTWEGTIGGSLLCVVVAVCLGYFTKKYTMITWVSIALCASVIGTLGDLLESKLKRTAGIKDSGNLMPGHGGALDRFDSLLLASPFIFIAAYFLLGS
jgi:phosphatidate cytidylyltransferase